MASAGDNTVSADLAAFVDSEAEERERWARIDREALILCEPLARMLGHKEICDALDVSKGQLSRELSPNYENNLALRTALLIGRRSQNERLAQIIVCDGLGLKWPEWQKRRVSESDELKSLRAQVREELPHMADSILDRAAKRARGGR